jgi:hypothetical protein
VVAAVSSAVLAVAAVSLLFVVVVVVLVVSVAAGAAAAPVSLAEVFAALLLLVPLVFALFGLVSRAGAPVAAVPCAAEVSVWGRVLSGAEPRLPLVRVLLPTPAVPLVVVPLRSAPGVAVVVWAVAKPQAAMRPAAAAMQVSRWCMLRM